MSILDGLFGEGFTGHNLMDINAYHKLKMDELQIKINALTTYSEHLELEIKSLQADNSKSMSDKDQCKIIIDYFIDRAIDEGGHNNNGYRQFVHYLSDEYQKERYERIFMLTLMKMGRPT